MFIRKGERSRRKEEERKEKRKNEERRKENLPFQKKRFINVVGSG